MSRTFYPRKTVFIPASAPHEEGTQYKISVGDEDWGNGTFQPVVKVQMVYDGHVAGRMSPSYPVGSRDWTAVQKAIEGLVGDEVIPENDEFMIPVMLTKNGILDELKEIISLTEDRPSSQKMRYVNARTGYINDKMTGIFEYSFFKLMDELKLLCDFKEDEGLETCDEMEKIIEKLDSYEEDFVPHLLENIENVRALVIERKSENRQID